MTRLASLRLFRRTQDFATREDGASTIPFVIFVPFFIMLVISSLEIGMLMIRHVMLERAVDLSVRDLRLGFWKPKSHAELKDRICSNAFLIPDCSNAMLVELRSVSKQTWSPLGTQATCVDRAATVQPITVFDPGKGDDMMLIRACVKFDPIFPMTGIGFHLPKDKTGAYALTAATAFVNEPEPGT